MAEITTRKLSSSGDFTGTINGVAPVLTEPGLSAAFQGHITNISSHATTANVTYYVNVSTGSDTNDGLTSGTPFKTIAKAINILPRFIDHTVTINVASGDYSSEGLLQISGINGKGFLSLIGDSTASTSYSISRINVIRCSTNINVKGFNGTSTAAQHFSAIYSVYVSFEACNSTISAAVKGFYAIGGSRVILKNCIVSNKDDGIYCELSEVLSDNVSGTGNTTGIYCDAGKVRKNGTQPSGTTAETKVRGGEIV